MCSSNFVNFNQEYANCEKNQRCVHPISWNFTKSTRTVKNICPLQSIVRLLENIYYILSKNFWQVIKISFCENAEINISFPPCKVYKTDVSEYCKSSKNLSLFSNTWSELNIEVKVSDMKERDLE